MGEHKFKGHASRLDSPPRNGENITPNDSTDCDNIGRALSVLVSGTVRVTGVGMADGTNFDIYVVAGNPFPGEYKRVWATGTTATGIAQMW